MSMDVCVCVIIFCASYFTMSHLIGSIKANSQTELNGKANEQQQLIFPLLLLSDEGPAFFPEFWT